MKAAGFINFWGEVSNSEWEAYGRSLEMKLRR
jgi:hypothetical protein